METGWVVRSLQRACYHPTDNPPRPPGTPPGEGIRLSMFARHTFHPSEGRSGNAQMSLFLFRASREKAAMRLAGLGGRRKPTRETAVCSARNSRRRRERWAHARVRDSNAEGRVLQAAAFPAQAREPPRSTPQPPAPPRRRGSERSTFNAVNAQRSKGHGRTLCPSGGQ